MSWFNLSKTMGSNYTVAPQDIVNTKTALNQLGYYPVPDRGIDDWTDDPMFDGIKAFQKDNGLKVDGLMRPGGPTEVAINARLDGQNDGQVVLAAGRRDPNVILPSQIPQNQRTPEGRPKVQPVLPPGWRYEDDTKGTAWDPNGQLHRRGTILGFPRWEEVPGRREAPRR